LPLERFYSASTKKTAAFLSISGLSAGIHRKGCCLGMVRRLEGRHDQGCQIFLGPNIPKREKYTKWPQTIPNDNKIYQIAVK
jgi:hypothetical protein